MSETIVVPNEKINAFKVALDAAAKAAADLAKIDKRLLDDTAVKFVVIRAQRTVYTNNEVKSGKSGAAAQRI